MEKCEIAAKITGARSRAGLLTVAKVGPSMHLGIAVAVWAVLVAGYTQYCKCGCEDKASVVSVVDKCVDCTLKYCQKQCSQSGELAVSCFQRESVKEQVVVYGFGLLVVGLIAAGFRRR